MKRIYPVIIICIFLSNSALIAQQQVILQRNGVATVFSTPTAFVDAYNAAQNGDTIYLPGIQYVAPANINKKLAVYGAGYHPDHTQATGRTQINGFALQAGAAGSHFEGMYINGSIDFAINTKVDNITLKRLHLTGNITVSGTMNPSDNIVIRECVFGQLNGQNTVNLKLFNSILGNIINLQYAWITNNVLHAFSSTYLLRQVYQSLIENNVFVRTTTPGYYFLNYNSNTFKNNIFTHDPTSNSENTWENSHILESTSNIFVSYEGTFSYQNDYHLVSPETYTGTTGNQIGLFGGLNPFKANAAPVLPRIISKNIATSADENGKLNVEVEVEAQNE